MPQVFVTLALSEYIVHLLILLIINKIHNLILKLIISKGLIWMMVNKITLVILLNEDDKILTIKIVKSQESLIT